MWTPQQASLVERMVHDDAYQLLLAHVTAKESSALVRLMNPDTEPGETNYLRGKIAAFREFHAEAIMREVEKVRAHKSEKP